MRWKKKGKPHPKDGEIKIYKKFIWFPMFNNNDNNWIWFETVEITKRFKDSHFFKRSNGETMFLKVCGF